MKPSTPFGPKHFARNAQTAVHQICEPLFKKLGLNYFHYGIFYKDGSLVALYNRMDWSDHFHSQQFRTQVPLANKEIQLGKYNLCLWQGTVNNQVVSDARNIFNFDHPLGINIAHNDYFESFAFGTHQGNDSIINTYFSNIETLFNFTTYFKEKAQAIIQKAAAEKFTLPKASQAAELKLLETLSSNLTIKNKNGWPVSITQKEAEILPLLSRGLTIREIAILLQRSPRTIEMHINNLKYKLACDKKSQLIAFALDHFHSQ